MSNEDKFPIQSLIMAPKRVYAPEAGLWCAEKLDQTTLCSKQQSIREVDVCSVVDTNEDDTDQEEYNSAIPSTEPLQKIGAIDDRSSRLQCSSKVQEWDGTEAGLLLVPPNGCVDWMDGTTLSEFHSNQKMAQAGNEHHPVDQSQTKSAGKGNSAKSAKCHAQPSSAKLDGSGFQCNSARKEALLCKKKRKISQLSPRWEESSMPMPGLSSPELSSTPSQCETQQGGVKATFSPSLKKWKIQPSTTLLKKLEPSRRSKMYKICNGRLFHINGERVSTDEKLC